MARQARTVEQSVQALSQASKPTRSQMPKKYHRAARGSVTTASTVNPALTEKKSVLRDKANAAWVLSNSPSDGEWEYSQLKMGWQSRMRKVTRNMAFLSP